MTTSSASVRALSAPVLSLDVRSNTKREFCMRIAISGGHRVGKTTLAEALANALPRYELVPEPYYLLEEEGHEFAAMPSIEDFELQLTRSLQCVRESGTNAIFDRCPLDILGYLITHREADTFHLADWMPRIRNCIAKLDLIVFVPIEQPERVAVPHSQANLRAEVDAVLRDIIVDDAYGFKVEVITATGTPETRLQQVVAHLRKTSN
jgi:AAA domain